MRKQERIQIVLNEINHLFPDAQCELVHKNPYELIVAVALSAQTTDVSVNKVTPALFAKFNTPELLASASLSDVENCIRSLGLYKNKSKNLIEMSRVLLEKYNGIVPSSKDELLTLPGVGVKTASVVLIEGYKIPAFPVDTHVERISKRLGIAKNSDNAIDVMNKLMKKYPKEMWGKLHHQMIFFGRYTCIARKPKCDQCLLKEKCREYFKL
jgi:endonuclease-3